MKKKSSHKVALIVILSLILLLAFLPSLLSTQWGKTFATQLISKELHIGSLSLSWFGPQKAREIVFDHFTCEEIATDASLFALFYHREIKTLRILKPSLTLSESLSLSTPSKKAPSKKKKPPLFKDTPFTGRLMIEKGMVTIQREKVSFSQVEIDTTLTKAPYLITFLASGVTSQNGVDGNFHLNGSLNPEQEKLLLEGKLHHFPVKGVDQLLAQSFPHLEGVLVDALGPSFDLNIDAQIERENPALHLHASSSYFEANLETITEGGVLRLKEPAFLRLALQPALASRLPGATLETGANIRLELNQLHVVLQDLQSSSFSGTLSMQKTGLSPEVTMENFKTNFATDSLKNGVSIDLSSRFLFTGQSAHFLGNSATFSSTAHWSPDRSQNPVNFSLESDRIELPALPFTFFTAEKRLHLSSPTQITYLPPDNPLIILKLEQADIPIEDLEKTQLQLDAMTESYLSLESLRLNLNMLGSKEIAIDLHEKNLTAQALLSYEKDRIDLKKPLVASGLLTNALLFPHKTGTFSMQPSPFRLEVSPFTLWLNEALLPQLQLQIKGFIDHLAITPTTTTLDKPAETHFEEIAINMEVNADKKMALMKLSSNSVRFNFLLQNLIFDKEIDTSFAKLTTELKLNSFSPALIAPWVDAGSSLFALMGPSIDLNMKAMSSPEEQNFSFSTSSSSLQGHLALTVKGDSLRLQTPLEPGQLSLTLTPEGFSAMRELVNKTALFDLNHNSKLEMIITDFIWPVTLTKNPKSLLERLPQPQENWALVELKGKAAIDAFSLKDKTSKRIVNLNSLKLAFNKGSQEQPIRLDLDSFLSSRESSNSPSSQEGKVNVHAQVDHLFTPDKAFDFDNLSIAIDATAYHFPTLLLDLFGSQAKLSELFGPSLQAHFRTQIDKMAGPVEINLQSPHVRSSLKGNVVEKALYLSEPIYAQIKVTPSVSNYILHLANPLDITEIRADNPLTLQIDPEEFVLPLFPFDLQKFKMKKARIELGKVLCKNEGSLNFTLGLLKSQQFTHKEALLLWFAPMEINLQKGILDIERTEILIADTFDIALWGNIDLIKDQVDIVLGLTADTLEQAFKIPDLPPNYVLHIPLKGTTSKITIDKAGATRKIALLLAWQQKALAAGLASQTPTGIIIGSLLKKIGPLPDFDRPTPPAKRPFPWENTPPSKKKSNHKTKIKFKEKPLKQLLKVFR